MGRNFDPSDSGYNEVASRIVEFRTKHPEGSLQPADMAKPFEVVAIGQDTFVVVVAAAYRTADDQRPGIGMAYEAYPGRTPYTRGSELQNAETSAWGRAIVAALAADTKKGIASAEDVRNRQAEQETWEQAAPAQPASRPLPTAEPSMRARDLFQLVTEAASLGELKALWESTNEAGVNGEITARDAEQLKAHITKRKDEVPPGVSSPSPEPAADGPTEKQHKHMHALWRETGLDGEVNRDARLAQTSLIVGRDVHTSANLTPDEADKVIAALDEQIQRKTAEPVGAAA